MFSSKRPRYIPHWASLVDQSRICLQYRRPEFDPWVQKIPWRRQWLPTLVFLPGECQGQRRLAMALQRVGHDWVIRSFTFHFHFPHYCGLVPGFHVVTATEPFTAKLWLLKVSFGPFLRHFFSPSSGLPYSPSEADVTAAPPFLSAVLLTLSAQLSNVVTILVLALGLGQVPRPYCLVTSC